MIYGITERIRRNQIVVCDIWKELNLKKRTLKSFNSTLLPASIDDLIPPALIIAIAAGVQVPSAGMGYLAN